MNSVTNILLPSPVAASSSWAILWRRSSFFRFLILLLSRPNGALPVSLLSVFLISSCILLSSSSLRSASVFGGPVGPPPIGGLGPPPIGGLGPPGPPPPKRLSLL